MKQYSYYSYIAFLCACTEKKRFKVCKIAPKKSVLKCAFRKNEKIFEKAIDKVVKNYYNDKRTKIWKNFFEKGKMLLW